MGQLDKRTQQQDVACLLEEFGQIESINVSYILINEMLCVLAFTFMLLLFKVNGIHIFALTGALVLLRLR